MQGVTKEHGFYFTKEHMRANKSKIAMKMWIMDITEETYILSANEKLAPKYIVWTQNFSLENGCSNLGEQHKIIKRTARTLS